MKAGKTRYDVGTRIRTTPGWGRETVTGTITHPFGEFGGYDHGAVAGIYIDEEHRAAFGDIGNLFPGDFVVLDEIGSRRNPGRSFTKPPWNVSLESGGTVVRGGHGGLVASMEAGSQLMRDNDAFLVSAAPDMLEACEAAFEELRPQYRSWGSKTPIGMLEKAIAKARGGRRHG